MLKYAVVAVLAAGLLAGTVTTAFAEGGSHSSAEKAALCAALKAKGKECPEKSGATTETKSKSEVDAAKYHDKTRDGQQISSDSKSEHKDKDQASASADKIKICHATGSVSNPYEKIKISASALNGHGDHACDLIPAPDAGCPEGVAAAAVKKDTTQHQIVEHRVVITHHIFVNGRELSLTNESAQPGTLAVKVFLNGKEIFANTVDKNQVINFDGDRKVDLKLSLDSLGIPAVAFTTGMLNAQLLVDGETAPVTALGGVVDNEGRLLVALNSESSVASAAPIAGPIEGAGAVFEVSATPTLVETISHDMDVPMERVLSATPPESAVAADAPVQQAVAPAPPATGGAGFLARAGRDGLTAALMVVALVGFTTWKLARQTQRSE
jgi:hypothetical protein